MQKLTDDLAAPWFLELWSIAPTPARARRLRKPAVEQILKRHRIRRVDADTVLSTLREPAIKVADGVAEAASIHLRSLIARLRVVNRELREAEAQLDKICMTIGESEATSGDRLRRQDVLILRSMPGIGRINLATLLCEASGPLGSRDYQALRTLCGAAPVTKRSGKSRIVIMRYAAHVRLRNTVYPVRSQVSCQVCSAAPTRPLARPCPAWCGRQTARLGLCAVAATDAIRSAPRSGSVDSTLFVAANGETTRSVPESDTEPRFGRLAGVKPRAAIAEGGLGLTPVSPAQAQ
jgi:hypothetical protein